MFRQYSTIAGTELVSVQKLYFGRVSWLVFINCSQFPIPKTELRIKCITIF